MQAGGGDNWKGRGGGGDKGRGCNGRSGQTSHNACNLNHDQQSTTALVLRVLLPPGLHQTPSPLWTICAQWRKQLRSIHNASRLTSRAKASATTESSRCAKATAFTAASERQRFDHTPEKAILMELRCGVKRRRGAACVRRPDCCVVSGCWHTTPYSTRGEVNLTGSSKNRWLRSCEPY